MAADTRATGGSIVGDKNCEKIKQLAPNMFCCGAGTAADCDHVKGKFYKQKKAKFLLISRRILFLIFVFSSHDFPRIGITQIEHGQRVPRLNGRSQTFISRIQVWWPCWSPCHSRWI